MSRKMNSTELEWLGDIPNDWKTIPNKHLMKKKKELCPKFNSENILSLSMKGVYIRDPNDESGKRPATYDGYQYVNNGDLLMCLFDIDVTPRCVGRVYDNGLTSPAYSRMVMNPKRANVDYYYYYYLALDFDKTLLHLSKNMRSSLTEADFGGIKAPVPSLPEQRQIVSFLDRKCSAIDVAIEKTKKSIEKLEEYKKAVITKAVTKGLDPDAKMKDSGVEWIGEVPEMWGTCRVKHVASKITDGAHISPVTENGQYDFISTVNLHNGKFDFDNCLKTDASSYAYMVNTGCQPVFNDVIISKDGSVGKTLTVDFEKSDYVVASSLVIIRPVLNKIIPKYLDYTLQSNFVQRKLEKLMHGSALKRVSVEKNANLYITLPPLSVQQRIVDFLNQKCEMISNLITKKQEAISKWEEYKKSLIYHAVTGKIDCRNEVV